jgi:hypothetical protein
MLSDETALPPEVGFFVAKAGENALGGQQFDLRGEVGRVRGAVATEAAAGTVSFQPACKERDFGFG